MNCRFGTRENAPMSFYRRLHRVEGALLRGKSWSILQAKRVGSRAICFFTVGIVCIILLAYNTPLFGQSAVLTWSANTDPATVGYMVYSGTASRTYGTPIDVGNQTTYTFSSLAPAEYYFAITAYNSSGVQSGFSSEVAKIVSATAPASHCDVNSDGAVNALDLQVLINALLTGTMLVNADLNRDGQVNALDLQILNNVILGTGSCPP